MKKFLYLALILTTVVAGCKKDDDDDDDDVVVQPQPYMEFSFNGVKYTSDDDNSSVNGQRQSSGGITAYNILGGFGNDLDIDVRIGVDQMSKGSYPLETGTSIRLFGSSSTYSSINGTGTIEVTEYADDRGTGTFSCSMTNFTDTIQLTGGKFEDIFLPN